MSLTEDPTGEPAPAEREKSAPPPLAELAGLDLAALMASRLCHDFISPASAIMSGLDLLDDPQAGDMRDEAMALINSSARKLVDGLQFARAAYGSGAESYGRDELESLAKGVFEHHRGDLDWSMAPAALGKAQSRALLNLAAVAAAALPMGGIATIRVEQDGETTTITADSVGNRARLRPELLAGLLGQGPGEGLAGHWIQAAWTQALIAQAGGTLTVAPEDGRVLFTVILPA